MVSGEHLSQSTRELVWAHTVLFHRTPLQIWRDIFFCVRVTLSYVELLCSRAAATSTAEDDISAGEFLDPRPPRSGGPKRVMAVSDVAAFLDIVRNNPHYTTVKARDVLMRDHYGRSHDIPSLPTLCRELKRNHFSRKVLEHRHILRDPVKRAAFLERVGPIAHTRLVDIDETLSTWKEFLSRRGYAPVGDPAFKTQFVINSKHFSAIVMYSAMGVLAYRITEGIFTSEEFDSFLNNEVDSALLPDMFGVLDNAAIHKTAEVRDTLERVFSGWYAFCAPYSPDFKPVERLFAMVKQILRDQEDAATADPENVLKTILDSFRPGNARAHHAENHFRMYVDNHNVWLNY